MDYKRPGALYDYEREIGANSRYWRVFARGSRSEAIAMCADPRDAERVIRGLNLLNACQFAIAKDKYGQFLTRILPFTKPFLETPL